MDIDRDYFNDNSRPGRLRDDRHRARLPEALGQDALDYVRYRHKDNDLVRAARQQDFLRQVRTAKGTKKLIAAASRRQPQEARAPLRPLLRPRQVAGLHQGDLQVR